MRHRPPHVRPHPLRTPHSTVTPFRRMVPLGTTANPHHDASDALDVVLGVMTEPMADEAVVLVMIPGQPAGLAIVVAGATSPGAMPRCVELAARAYPGSSLVVATTRLTSAWKAADLRTTADIAMAITNVVPDDLDQWWEGCAVAQREGAMLLDWFVCSHSHEVSVPDQFDVAPRPGWRSLNGRW